MTSQPDCKNCNFHLDDEEIIIVLSRLKEYSNLPLENLEKIAMMYGWTRENKKCFRKDIVIQFSNKPQIEICPVCRVIFPRILEYPKSFYKT